MGKRLAAVGTAAAIGIGGLTVAAVNPLGIAGAQAKPAVTAPASGTPAAGAKADRQGPVERALAGLVANGTLTKDQATKVETAITAEVKDSGSARKGHRAELVKVVADAIGSTPEQVTAGLKGGTSIADQAKAKGVDRQVVDDAVTKTLTARIDRALKAGKLTDDQAAKAKDRLDKVVPRILDADGSHLGHGRGNLRSRIKARQGN